METAVILGFIIFLVSKIAEVCKAFFTPMPKGTVFDTNPAQYMVLVNEFIRREASIEIEKWITESRYTKNTMTNDSAFISQITSAEEVKKKTTTIAIIVSEKMSSDLKTAFNRVYKKTPVYIKKNAPVDTVLQEYIGRYVLFLFRRLSHDVTILINDPANKTKRIDDILNIYLLQLEEAIYKDNGFYLVPDANLKLFEYEAENKE
jgi:hypothetical protein